MVDRQQAYLIQINHLFKGLHKAKAKETTALLNVFAVYLDVLRGVRNVALPWANPMPDNAGAQHVSDEAITFTVPYPTHRTRAASAIDFCDFRPAVGGNLSFVLDHTARPKRAYHIHSALFSQTNNEVGGALTEIP